ncbi:response regulator [Pedobacter metabolipauper]|uniref:Response regulator receiver domain-containing protein n=1 Tax=Pedobacter metabolipauper TaxID=425513 RepID=A0A4R6T2R5_9SPHI|nr:response regulator [Pedobacter metabolipauper]TDQ12018.1 response regulator receiver domain-containing protein [Pedobacter metabolipauper]
MAKKQILIVDDEVSILKLLNFVLSNDYELIIKNSGVEALTWLEEGNSPALILSDLEMPYFDGSSFIHNLKISGFYRDTPVIILSGANNLTERVSQMSFKLDAFIPKPFNPVQLKEAILDVFKKHESIGKY